MKILFMCGDYPPNSKCATADTSFIMVNILEKRNIDVKLVTNISWKLNNLFNIIKIIKDNNADAMFIPYATISYGYSIVPQILSLLYRKKIVILIHEVSQAFIVRKFALLPFSLCHYVVFTNQFERSFFHKIFPWTQKSKTRVIPIGSNIESKFKLNFDFRCHTNIIHFGQIRPKKGIEDIITLAEIIQKNNLPFTITIVGRILESAKDYYNKIQDESKHYPIIWRLNESESEVSKILGSNSIAYFPFPDGASERRGTLFAALIHDMVIFTTKGNHSIKEFNDCVTFISNPNQLFEFISSNHFLTNLSLINKRNQLVIPTFLRKYNWEVIMDQYITIFNHIAHKKM